MPYVEGIVVAKSRKNSGYCLVIYDINKKRFFRIVSGVKNRIHGELYDEDCQTFDNHVINVLDVVKVPVISFNLVPDQFQSENLYISHSPIIYIKTVTKKDLIDLVGIDSLNSSREIFINRRGTMTVDEAKRCKSSFIFARVFNLHFYKALNSKGEPTCKCSFKYNGQEYEDISVTISKTKDEDIRKYTLKGKIYPVAYVCFSFGSEYDGKCFKFLCSFLGYSYYY